MTDQEIIDAHIPVTESGCWIWTKRDHPTGYGQVWWRGKHNPASRVMYELFKGPIPKGMQVCHHCDVRPCGNPDHLFLGDHKANSYDAVKKGRVVWANIQALSRAKISTRTHCKNGHLYSEVGWYVSKDGRWCKGCMKANYKARRLRKTMEVGR